MFQFPVLQFNSLAVRISEWTGQKIKPSDLSIGSKVDGIICHCLFKFFGISLNPSVRSLYALALMKKFEQMKFPESFTSSDFAEERDPKKMSRVLSWLFQFFETLAPANDYAYNVWNSYKEKASHAASLKDKVISLKTSNKAEEIKRSEYQRIVAGLMSSLTEKLAAKKESDELISTINRKLSQLTDTEKSNSLEASNLYIKLNELRSLRESLRSQVIENPSLLPKSLEELKAKQNTLELEMQEIRSKTFQVEQSIIEFKLLHEVIDKQLVAVAKNCHLLLRQLSECQKDLERSDKEMSERFKSVDLLGKKIASCTEQLQLSEHNIVKAKVLEATQTVANDRIKKEKATFLDKYCFAFKSLESEVTAMEALLKTSKVLYENEYSNKKREDDWKKVDVLKDILQRLYHAYADS